MWIQWTKSNIIMFKLPFTDCRHHHQWGFQASNHHYLILASYGIILKVWTQCTKSHITKCKKLGIVLKFKTQGIISNITRFEKLQIQDFPWIFLISLIHQNNSCLVFTINLFFFYKTRFHFFPKLWIYLFFILNLSFPNINLFSKLIKLFLKEMSVTWKF